MITGTRRFRGVTLIEMMLVLMIMALIAVSVIQYANRQRDEAASQKLGEKLYVYGQAVRAYLLDNQAAIRGTPQGTLSGISPASGKYTFTGVSWLQDPPKGTANPNPEANANPYLEDNFTFNTGMHPLFVGPVTGTADTLITTTVEFKTAGDKTSPLLVTINIPGLYKDVKGVSVPMPDISVRAADYANKYYSSIAGGSAFYYEYKLPADGDFTKSSIIGTLRDIAEQEDYLRVDGQNYMKQSIVLAEPTDDAPFAAPTDSGARNIFGVERIYFDATNEGVPTGITDIDAILFNNANSTMLKTIEGLNSLKFSDAGSSAITNLDAVNFTGASSAINEIQLINMVAPTISSTANQLGAIVNVNRLIFSGNTISPPSIQFVNNLGKISGVQELKLAPRPTITGQPGKITFGNNQTFTQFLYGSDYTGDGDMTNVSTSFCYLVRVQFKNVSSGDPAGCEISIVGTQWHLDKRGTDNTCHAKCITYTTNSF